MLSCKRVGGRDVFIFGDIFFQSPFSYVSVWFWKQATVLYGFFLNVHFETDDQIFSEIPE